ncbi:MAG: redoxin domain-containing protein [Deltaproteobacteria bacterium]|nr:redoxin domain-containing protein [Deltaproteobacteria bacterium]
MAKRSVAGVGDIAPDFALDDTEGNEVCLGSYRQQQPVVLVFNRGFT